MRTPGNARRTSVSVTEKDSYTGGDICRQVSHLYARKSIGTGRGRSSTKPQRSISQRTVTACLCPSAAQASTCACAAIGIMERASEDQMGTCTSDSSSTQATAFKRDRPEDRTSSCSTHVGATSLFSKYIVWLNGMYVRRPGFSEIMDLISGVPKWYLFGARLL